MSAPPSVQWKIDNQAEIEELLAPFEARCIRDEDDLLVQAWGGLNVTLAPGDCLLLDGSRLGILRAPQDPKLAV